ncbi:DsbA family protein [Actinoallomurus purpureus]|uniref:DsbA family oxidoreductase n=1 Tax=Actinoallomurus purpureus TaxID=478114 RepID=UPI002092C9C0|nr:DsbA family protein [Actinoallomurus purpureus]MCO6004911.1 DsbA family protein [Actinoallomurus purpureus]
MSYERQSVHVRIVLDVICAHSYLGYTRFTRAADRLRDDGVQVTVKFLPFELAPGASTEGRPLLAVLEQTFGPEAVSGTAHFAEHAAREGLRFEYGKAVATGTFEAHRLIASAAHRNKAGQMTERLFRAHFTDGLHIGDAATLARLAAEVGVAMDDFPPGELRARLHRVRALGITARTAGPRTRTGRRWPPRRCSTS